MQTNVIFWHNLSAGEGSQTPKVPAEPPGSIGIMRTSKKIATNRRPFKIVENDKWQKAMIKQPGRKTIISGQRFFLKTLRGSGPTHVWGGTPGAQGPTFGGSKKNFGALC